MAVPHDADKRFHMFSLVFPSSVMNNFKSQQGNLYFCTVQKRNEDHERDTQGALREDTRKRLLGRPTESGQSSFTHMRPCMITSLGAGPGCVEGGLKQSDQDLITVNLRISVQ